jgi:hypothetical protein
MMDTLMNILFRCSHRRLSRPAGTASRAGSGDPGTYVVCLDCGKQFAYDPIEMRVGRPIPAPPPTDFLIRGNL